MDWQKIFYICASVGAIATAISILYLFYQDFKKGKQISDLTRVATALEKDLELRYQPHLWLNGVSTLGVKNTIDFDLNNKREWCRLLEFNMISGDIIFDERSKHLPYELEPSISEARDTTRRYIFCSNNSNKSLKDVKYKFEIVYEDRLGVKYSVEISGVGSSAKMSNPQIL